MDVEIKDLAIERDGGIEILGHQLEPHRGPRCPHDVVGFEFFGLPQGDGCPCRVDDERPRPRIADRHVLHRDLAAGRLGLGSSRRQILDVEEHAPLRGHRTARGAFHPGDIHEPADERVAAVNKVVAVEFGSEILKPPTE